jgi:hypothetical protein
MGFIGLSEVLGVKRLWKLSSFIQATRLGSKKRQEPLSPQNFRANRNEKWNLFAWPFLNKNVVKSEHNF